MRRFLLACTCLFTSLLAEQTETLPIPLVEACYEVQIKGYEGAHLLDTQFEVILSEEDEMLKMQAWFLGGKIRLRELDTYTIEPLEGALQVSSDGSFTLGQTAEEPCYTAYWKFDEESKSNPLVLLEWDYPELKNGIELKRDKPTTDHCEPIREKICHMLFSALLFDEENGSTPFDDAVNFIYYHTRPKAPKKDFRKVLTTDHKDRAQTRVPIRELVELSRQEQKDQLQLSTETQRDIELFVSGKEADYFIREAGNIDELSELDTFLEELQARSWAEAVDWGTHKEKHPFFQGGVLSRLGSNPTRTVSFKLHAAIWRELEVEDDVDPDAIRVKK